MNIQSEPVEDGHDDATGSEKIEGLVEQMQSDIASGNVGDPGEVLRQRLADSGLEVDDVRFAELLARITS